MRVELFFRPHLYPGGDLRGILDVAQAADTAGLRAIMFGEHLVVGSRLDRYPYGAFSHPRLTPWLDPLTTLAAVAAVTSQLRLSTGVLLVPLRPAAVLAKAVATLDVLSAGRVELGIGTGWQREEYDAVGRSWSSRYEAFDECVSLCRSLWEGGPVQACSGDAILDGVVALPPPVQPRIPLLYGVAATPAHVERIARLGDGWWPVGATPQKVAAGVDALREAFQCQDRDPGTLRVRVSLPAVQGSGGRFDAAATMGPARDFFAAGATTICTGPITAPGSVAELHRLINELATIGHDLG